MLSSQSLARRLFPERLSKPSALHGVEAREQEILGIGVWGKGVQSFLLCSE